MKKIVPFYEAPRIEQLRVLGKLADPKAAVKWCRDFSNIIKESAQITEEERNLISAYCNILLKKAKDISLSDAKAEDLRDVLGAFKIVSDVVLSKSALRGVSLKQRASGLTEEQKKFSKNAAAYWAFLEKALSNLIGYDEEIDAHTNSYLVSALAYCWYTPYKPTKGDAFFEEFSAVWGRLRKPEFVAPLIKKAFNRYTDASIEIEIRSALIYSIGRMVKGKVSLLSPAALFSLTPEFFEPTGSTNESIFVNIRSWSQILLGYKDIVEALIESKELTKSESGPSVIDISEKAEPIVDVLYKSIPTVMKRIEKDFDSAIRSKNGVARNPMVTGEGVSTTLMALYTLSRNFDALFDTLLESLESIVHKCILLLNIDTERMVQNDLTVVNTLKPILWFKKNDFFEKVIPTLKQSTQKTVYMWHHLKHKHVISKMDAATKWRFLRALTESAWLGLFESDPKKDTLQINGPSDKKVVTFDSVIDELLKEIDSEGVLDFDSRVVPDILLALLYLSHLQGRLSTGTLYRTARLAEEHLEFFELKPSEKELLKDILLRLASIDKSHLRIGTVLGIDIEESELAAESPVAFKPAEADSGSSSVFVFDFKEPSPKWDEIATSFGTFEIQGLPETPFVAATGRDATKEKLTVEHLVIQQADPVTIDHWLALDTWIQLETTSVLELSRSVLGAFCIQGIAESFPALTQLRFRKCHIGMQDIVEIMNHIGQDEAPRTVSFIDCTFDIDVQDLGDLEEIGSDANLAIEMAFTTVGLAPHESEGASASSGKPASDAWVVAGKDNKKGKRKGRRR